MVSKEKSLADIHEKWKKECVCALKHEVTQPVPGHGNPKSSMVFIGEAPGKDEDIQGKPFVGAAGKFLDTMLQEVKLERKDVYITNIVKYRPPNNRDPLSTEVAECLPWLYEELNCIDPKIIITLGRHALNVFFPDARISNVHGKLLKKKIKGLDVHDFFALYHPAAALYNGSMRKVLIDDFKKVDKVLEMIDGSEEVGEKEEDTNPAKHSSKAKKVPRESSDKKTKEGPKQESLF